VADPFDYAEVAANALEVVQEFGTTIAVCKLNTTPADSSKPWRGAADPRAPYADSQTVNAVNVPVSGIGKLVNKKNIPDNAQDFWIVAPGLSTPDLSDYDEIVYNGTTSRFVAVTVLKPAAAILLYVMVTLK
jgi:hypothetical protein